jgi:hypothetical protein
VVLDRAGTEGKLPGNRAGIGAVSSRQDDIAFPGRQRAQVCSGDHHSRMSHDPGPA